MQFFSCKKIKVNPVTQHGSRLDFVLLVQIGVKNFKEKKVIDFFNIATVCLKALFKVKLASAKSNGARLVSATAPIKKITKIGNKGNINHTAF